MVKKYLICFVLLFFFQDHLFSGKYHMSMEKERAVNKVLNKVEKTLCARYDMNCIGSGGAMMYEVEYLKLQFQINKPLNKEEVRKIIIDSTDVFLSTINQDSELRKFLKVYPFGPKDISIGILIYNYDRTSPLHPNLSAAGMTVGRISYHTDDGSDSWKYKETTEESYEEAKQIVERQKELEEKKE